MTALVSSPIQSLKGAARVPGDKSISHRALMLGALAHGVTSISGLLEGEDVLRTARALISMGVIITPPDVRNGIWRVTGMAGRPLRSPRATVYLGNSGTSARLLLGIGAGEPVSATFTGDDSLSRRPMGRVIKPLSLMGARFEASGGDRLPLRLTGAKTLRPIAYTLPVPSAQVKSAILLAALRAPGETRVTESAPTRDHTERMLRYFGAEVFSEGQPDGTQTVMLTGGQPLKARQIAVPGDPSSAAFLAVAALITPHSDIVIPNMLVNPLRMGLYETLKEMGADITFENTKERCGEPVADMRVRSSALRGVAVPPERVPSMIDEFPILAVAAAFADGKTEMSGLEELRVKESNRLLAMAEGLEANGVRVERGQNSLAVHGTGQGPQGGGLVKTRMDHRIAMSFLVLGMGAQKPVTIDSAESVATSFPGFAELMNGLGAAITAQKSV